MGPDDATLLDQWRSGDRAAGNELFGRHFDAVHRFFSHKVDAEAADLTQRTFLACVEGTVRFRGDASFRTFLFGIARNELFAYWRKRKRQPELDVASSSIADLSPTPSTYLRKQQSGDALLAALRALPLDLQIALEMHYLERLPSPEIGMILEIPEGTVRSRLRRAKELLRDTLGDAHDLSMSDASLDGWGEALRGLSSPAGDES